MDVETIAKMLHEAGRAAVEKGHVVNRKECTNRSGLNNVICAHGMLLFIVRIYANGRVKTRETGETCPRCKGTGYEPFLEWNEITEEAREGRRDQARYLLPILVEPLEKKIAELEGKTIQAILKDDEEKKVVDLPLTDGQVNDLHSRIHVAKKNEL